LLACASRGAGITALIWRDVSRPLLPGGTRTEAKDDIDAHVIDPSAVLGEFASANDSFQLIVLFGSFAKNRARADSDVDVGVWPQAALTAEQWLQLRDELAWRLQRTVDVVDLSTLHGPLLEEILDSGKKIYERPGARALEALMRRRIYDDADFMPLYRRAQKVRRDRFLDTPIITAAHQGGKS